MGHFEDPRIVLSEDLKQIGLVEKDAITIALDAGSSQTIINIEYLINNFDFSKDILSEILNLVSRFYLGQLSDY